MDVVTSTPLTLSYFVQDITGALVTFNRMRWLRSRTGETGLYEAATAASATPAVLTARSAGPHSLNGKTLDITINGTIEVSVSFSGADPYSTAAAVIDINNATSDLVASTSADDELVLTTVSTGSEASIEIEESDAAPYLGFETGDAVVGLDADIVLVGGTYQYFYTDENSDESAFYKIQLLHSVTAQVSDLSVPIPADQIPVISYSETLVAFIKLADMTGRPIAGREITINNVFVPNKVQDHGIFRHSLKLVTDRSGYAETRILRGITVDMSIDGTNFVRRIEIPTTGDLVDLLDSSLAPDDEFGIQQPDINFAVRTS